MFLKLGRDYVLVTCTHMMSIYNNNSNSMVLHVQNIRRDKSSHALLICQFLTYKASFGFNSFNLREQIQGIWILSIHFPLHLSPSDIWIVDCIKWSKKSRNSDNKMKLRHVLRPKTQMEKDGERNKHRGFKLINEVRHMINSSTFPVQTLLFSNLPCLFNFRHLLCDLLHLLCDFLHLLPKIYQVFSPLPSLPAKMAYIQNLVNNFNFYYWAKKSIGYMKRLSNIFMNYVDLFFPVCKSSDEEEENYLDNGAWNYSNPKALWSEMCNKAK